MSLPGLPAATDLVTLLRASAACKDTPGSHDSQLPGETPEVYRAREAAAVELCSNHCAVRDECALWALWHASVDGVAGGLTRAEREAWQLRFFGEVLEDVVLSDTGARWEERRRIAEMMLRAGHDAHDVAERYRAEGLAYNSAAASRRMVERVKSRYGMGSAREAAA